jgi:hypothetical protein
MLGNFFMLTCPYLYDLETITYFALQRDYHSFHAIESIQETTQLFLDVFHYDEKLYIHPIKVQHRYSTTMHLLHRWEDASFTPITNSYIIADVLNESHTSPLDTSRSRQGVWMRTLALAKDAQRQIEGGHRKPEDYHDLFHRLLRMTISRDDRVLALAAKYFTIRDLAEAGKRTIGTGLIGGKAVGMLLARAILAHSGEVWREKLEVHDSFYIGSDVFYTFLVRNGVWWLRQKQKDAATFMDGAEQGRRRILTGTFPDYIVRQFEDVLDYYGQSPIIVRSSSLLEDNFGNAFAGKYDSVFCANQGSRHKRLEDFVSAVRTIYASTMSERALSYRARRGILDRDEQMALLIQRVSGSGHGSLHYPHIAGVGFSFNPYVWSEYIQPEAGVLRLVFGLGTRAVDRQDDDYTRIIALNAPERRPESGRAEISQYAQRKVDVLDLEANLLVTSDFQEVVEQSPSLPLSLFAARDEGVDRAARERGMKPPFSWTLTFDNLVSKTPFVSDMKEMLGAIQDAYEHPVDVEFTTNFLEDGSYRVNLVQCRPLQVKSSLPIIDPPANLPDSDLILKTGGPLIGQSRVDTIDRFIYVVPSVYGQLPVNERYRVARVVGQAVHARSEKDSPVIMLLGPGRWGTTTPSLGVPVSFAEINKVSVICEIVAMREDLVPDVSLGTHFFSELVEMDMLYVAMFPGHEGNMLNMEMLESAPNRLGELLPNASPFSHLVRVVEAADLTGKPVRLNANTLKQRLLCYLE